MSQQTTTNNRHLGGSAGQRLAALAILVVFAACGGTPIPTSTPTPSLPDVMDVRSALLALSDLLPGWASVPNSPSNNLSTVGCGAPPPDVQETTATAVFQTETGAHLSETIAAFHVGDAEQWLTALQADTNCDQISVGDNQEIPITAQIMNPTYPPLGDQLFARRVTSDFGSGTYVTDVIYVRTGDFILQIGNVTVAKPDPTLTASLVQKAFDKLKAAQF